jgi:hypothetical protein
VTLRGQFIDPYIVYPGNIQGRHGKEQGEKSCELVTSFSRSADRNTVTADERQHRQAGEPK